jgi:hypothetical protein
MEKKEEVGFPSLFKLHNPLDTNQRVPEPFSDDLHLSKATIYKVLGVGNDRLQVLPLALEGIEEDEMKNLPRYPHLIKGCVLTGKSIKADGKENADKVWIVSTPDFQVGYIVGKCNSFGENTDSKWPYSYNYKAVKDFLHGRSALPDDFKYEHLDVIRMVMTDDGGMIELVNNRNGDWVLMNTSGSTITVQQKKIYLRVGTPPNPVSTGPVGFSAITMTPDKIHMKAPNIELDGKQLTLGHHNLELAALPGGVCIGKNGVSAQTISNIHV